MATGRRYYWIRLKDSFFADDGPADFLMSQPNGANYVVLYQMLCLKTINTGGRLSNQIGEIIIPYDIEKIRRTCKYFSAGTVRIALNLYKDLGLVYEDADGTLVMTDHESLVGSETDWAEKKRRQLMGKNAPERSPSDGEIGGENFPIEIRDKEIRDKEIRDKEIRDKKKRDIEKRKADAFADFAGDDGVLLAALRDFAKMRKSIKRPLTDEAAKRLLSKLRKNFPREEWVAVINQSVDHCWQGLFPLKGDAAQSQRSPGNAPKPQRTAMDDLQELHAMFEAEEG